MTTTKTVSQIIADRMIEQLEQGVVPWHKPWDKIAKKYNYVSGRQYDFMNQMILKHEGYITFDKAMSLGWKPNQSLKGQYERVFQFFFKEYDKVDKDNKPVINPKTGEKETYKHFYMSYYKVLSVSLFNDKNGNPVKEKTIRRQYTEAEANVNAEKVIDNYLVKDGNGLKFNNFMPSDEAYYSPAYDVVVVPEMSQYKEASEYYSTCFHELTHSTGAPARLARLKTTDHETKSYSKEELVAELGACILSSITGVSTESSFDNSAAYIAGWNKRLHDNPDDVVSACKLAEKAVKMIAKDMIDENMELIEEEAAEVSPSISYTSFKPTENFYRITGKKQSVEFDADLMKTNIIYNKLVTDGMPRGYYLTVMPVKSEFHTGELGTSRIFKESSLMKWTHKPELLLKVDRKNKKQETQAVCEAKQMINSILEDDDYYKVDTTAPVLL